MKNISTTTATCQICHRDIDLQTYGTFQPTGFDAKGLGLEEQQHWFVAPTMRTRDSGILEESNFQTALASLGNESDTIKVHRFGHWGCGWFEIILIDPQDHEALHAAHEIDEALADYPVLDEMDHSRREWEAMTEAWEMMSLEDRVEVCREAGASIFAARRDELPTGNIYAEHLGIGL